jgi:hypothetical protein
MMAQGRREALVENLALASVVGFIVVVVAAVSLLSDSRSSAEEGAALAAAFSASGAELKTRVEDPCLERIFELRSGGALSYGTIIALRSPDSSILIGARFSSKGELRGLARMDRALDSGDEELRDGIDRIPGAEEALERAASAVRQAAGTAEAGS